MNYQQFEHPLRTRYGSNEMLFLWSPQKKFDTWRLLWLCLAESQQELGLDYITNEQLDEMRKHLHLEAADFEFAEQKEKELRHDVMAHIHAFGKVCPKAMPIIHLGATSCFVGDNTDLILMKESVCLLQKKMAPLFDVLKAFALKHRSLATLGYTHGQAAQLTTVGKRCTLWMQDLLSDYHAFTRLIEELPFRGVKGTTGSQASYLDLFDGDHAKVKELERKVCAKMGFTKCQAVCGQTYSRKLDVLVMNALSGLAESAYKMVGDLRLLSSFKEIEEPFESTQIGSSAMAYKRNPVCSEQICSVARYLMNLAPNAVQTHCVQWLERSLDDSANRRMILPEAFLAADFIVTSLKKVSDGLVVWPQVIANRIKAELPFMATEVILMRAVKAGGDRQRLHEALRKHSMEAGHRVKHEGAANDLMERIAADPLFAGIPFELDPAQLIGRCPEQVLDFINEHIVPNFQTNVVV